jgi:hypothetical protein
MITTKDDRLVVDGVHGTCIHTGAAVDTVVSVNNPFASCFSDCAYRTGIITSSAVDALVSNSISQFVHLPFVFWFDKILANRKIS